MFNLAGRSKGTPVEVPKKVKKMICQNKSCDSMGRFLPENDFDKSRNPSIGRHPFCKECVRKSINLDDINTLYDVLKVLDTPFVFDVWSEALSMAGEDGNYFDVYLDLINNTYKTKYKDARFENSIFESQIYGSVNDVGLKLDKAEERQWDNIWQGYYTEKELEYLNDYYQDLQNDFKIITRNHKDYARKIAQASLAMNTAYNMMRDNPEDRDMANTYKMAADNFDRLSKSAQFAESQRGANDVTLGCFGRVFDAVEHHNFVPTHIPEDKDMFDKIIEQFSNINRSL